MGIRGERGRATVEYVGAAGHEIDDPDQAAPYLHASPAAPDAATSGRVGDTPRVAGYALPLWPKWNSAPGSFQRASFDAFPRRVAVARTVLSACRVDDRDIVGGKPVVCGDDGEALGAGLRDEEAVERIAVV